MKLPDSKHVLRVHRERGHQLVMDDTPLCQSIDLGDTNNSTVVELLSSYFKIMEWRKTNSSRKVEASRENWVEENPKESNWKKMDGTDSKGEERRGEKSG